MLKGAALTVGIFGVALSLFVWSGIYDVAATAPHLEVTKWLFATARDQSIQTHSHSMTSPPLEQEDLVREGLKSYHSMCIVCHSAPGKEASVIRRGLNPKPPKLEKAQTQQRSDAELFWIIQHGIKMTGMPAFGPTHDEPTLWELVAFLRKLPNLSAEDYQAMVMAAGLGEPPNMHVHDNEGHVDGPIDGHGHVGDLSTNHQH
jgi:mono/diheme cytochrome c family protein